MPKILWIGLLCFTFWSCVKEDAESKYSDSIDQEQLMLFDEQILPILDLKCNSCHDYHNTLSTEYISFERTAGNIDEIIERVTSVGSLGAMPPPSAQALTSSEIQLFEQFRDLLENSSTDPIIKFKWTAFKYPIFSNREGVNGTFDNINWVINQDGVDIYDKLDGAELSILTSSINLGGSDSKSTNLREYFFSKLTPTIHCKLLSINFDNATVAVTINGIMKEISLDVSIEEETFKLAGTIEDLHQFNTSDAFISLDEICGIHHENFVWPDVDLELTIKNFIKL